MSNEPRFAQHHCASSAQLRQRTVSPGQWRMWIQLGPGTSSPCALARASDGASAHSRGCNPVRYARPQRRSCTGMVRCSSKSSGRRLLAMHHEHHCRLALRSANRAFRGDPSVHDPRGSGRPGSGPRHTLRAKARSRPGSPRVPGARVRLRVPRQHRWIADAGRRRELAASSVCRYPSFAYLPAPRHARRASIGGRAFLHAHKQASDRRCYVPHG